MACSLLINTIPSNLTSSTINITLDSLIIHSKLVATHGCSTSHPLQDIFSAKKLHNKTHGKQGEHFVLSLPPRCSEREPLKFLSTVTEIVRTVYPEFMSVIAVHTDSKALHAHVLINSVNSVTGHKFSQSPLDLNRVKQKTNGILKKHRNPPHYPPKTRININERSQSHERKVTNKKQFQIN